MKLSKSEISHREIIPATEMDETPLLTGCRKRALPIFPICQLRSPSLPHGWLAHILKNNHFYPRPFALITKSRHQAVQFVRSCSLGCDREEVSIFKAQWSTRRKPTSSSEIQYCLYKLSAALGVDYSLVTLFFLQIVITRTSVLSGTEDNILFNDY